MTFGELKFDRTTGTLTGARGSRALTAKEATMFAAIAEGGLFVQRSVLKEQVWGDAGVSDGTFDKLLHRLRASLTEVTATARLVSIYGAGVGLRLTSGPRPSLG